MPWFWRGDLQGGGVLNDMMCHSLEVGRHLLTEPGAPRDSIRPIKVSAQIASLKWSRPRVRGAAAGDRWAPEVDYAKRPAEDFARATVGYVDEAGHPLIVRGHHVVELRGRGPAALAWSCSGRSTRCP